MGRLYAGILGPLAMAVVICRGALDSSGTAKTLSISIIALVVFSIVGAALGQIAQSTIDESVRKKMELELAAQAPAGGRIAEAAT